MLSIQFFSVAEEAQSDLCAAFQHERRWESRLRAVRCAFNYKNESRDETRRHFM